MTDREGVALLAGNQYNPSGLKTLVFAKDDTHAENIVGILREEFGKGNEFAQKTPIAPPG